MDFWPTEKEAPPPLTEREKENRERFVHEYLFDYDAVGAAMRIGFSKSFAESMGQQLLDDVYVRRRIAERQKAMADDPKSEDEQSRRQIRAMLMREANYRGPGSSHAARVAAMAKLMSLYDMDAPIKTKNENVHRGGVMAVPGIASAEDWQNEASKSQSQLQKDSEVSALPED